MVKNPLISIVVPSYNVAPYIRQCVESILNQTFSNWELLLVVGGTDGTIEICDEYAAKDSRIKSIHDNKGLVQARNVGYHHATGEWITYLDGDDWFDSKNLIDFVSFLKDCEVDMVLTQYTHFYEPQMTTELVEQEYRYNIVLF